MRYEELGLNDDAFSQVEDLIAVDDMAGIEVVPIGDSDVIDCGVNTPGSLYAGIIVAEITMGGLGDVDILMDRLADRPCPKVHVNVDVPAVGCLLSQYAGWKVSHGDFFAMASGPIRAIRGKEPVFDSLEYSEDFEVAVGVLEAASLPSAEIIEKIADELDLSPDDICLLVAPTSSIVGTTQVVSRSVETCLHKLFELGFDVSRIRSAVGSAFLPPVPKDDLTAIGRTNDSILYGGEVFIWLDGEDDQAIEEIGPNVPASSSPDYGEPFASIFQRYGGDFYQIDPMLFSPAQVTFNNVRTGFCRTYGKLNYDVLTKSLFGE